MGGSQVVNEYGYTGSNPGAGNFCAVVQVEQRYDDSSLTGTPVPRPMSATCQQALQNYVQNGGGYLSTGFLDCSSPVASDVNADMSELISHHAPGTGSPVPLT